MPVTKTAKRALRSSKKKLEVNKLMKARLEIAIRVAKKSKTKTKVIDAISLVDKTRKKHLIHKNKASRIKSSLARHLPKERKQKAVKASKKTKK